MILTNTEFWVCLQEDFSNAELSAEVLSWVALQLPTSSPASCAGKNLRDPPDPVTRVLTVWKHTSPQLPFYVGSGELHSWSHAWIGWNPSDTKVSEWVSIRGSERALYPAGCDTLTSGQTTGSPWPRHNCFCNNQVWNQIAPFEWTTVICTANFRPVQARKSKQTAMCLPPGTRLHPSH